VDHADGRALTASSEAPDEVSGTSEFGVRDAGVDGVHSCGALADRVRVDGTPEPGSDAARGRTWRAVGGLVGRHRLFAVLLLAGVLLRLCAILAYSPALWFNDAFEYVSVAIGRTPYVIRPNGYSWFLQLLEPAHSVTLVVVIQHVLGLVAATLIYAIVRRLGLAAWAACLAALPLVLDSFEVEIEHILLSDTLFTVLLFVAAFLVLSPWKPGVARTVAVGLLLAAAMLTRPAALPLIVLFGLFILFRRLGWRALIGFVLAVVIPLGAYAFWYRSVHGVFALQNSSGIQLYGRVAGFADCRVIQPPAQLRVLCPEPPGNGQPAPAWVWHSNSPLAKVPGDTFSPQKEHLAQSFAIQAILHQPKAYLRAVARDVWHGMAWDRGPYPNAYTTRGYEFSLKPWPITHAQLPNGMTQQYATSAYAQGAPTTRTRQPFASLLIDYQRYVRMPGTVLTALFVTGVVGLLPRKRAGERVSRFVLAFVLLNGLALAVGPILTVQLDYRYLLPSAGFATTAAVLGAARWWEHRRSAVLPTLVQE
jgi:hypothetical protein